MKIFVLNDLDYNYFVGTKEQLLNFSKTDSFQEILENCPYVTMWINGVMEKDFGYFLDVDSLVNKLKNEI